jgi:2-polyprenyl-6-hydroxyphenyl methylase/3-demethylubiquinone-9 3-methyltransferase
MNVSNAPQAAYFNELAGQWWDESGAFGVLHAMNPVRIKFIKNLVNEYFPTQGLQNLKVLDVGCGGGIACEPLARLGAKVTGIDASEAAIDVAKDHATAQGLEIDYLCSDLKDINQTFDLITCLEVVEHVDDLPIFLSNLATRLNSKGLLVLSTINRTWFSYLVGIVGAEYLTRKVPVGTHDWHKFIEPAQLVELIEQLGLRAISLKGLNYSVLNREWHMEGDLKMNYLAGFLKV